jgi:hypothetical protein
MNKYVILVVLNAPLIIYALAKSIIYFKEGLYSKMQLGFRLVFWLGALAGMIFAKSIYDFLVHKDLTDSAPLSLADVLLTTACFLSLTMLIRLYARVDKAERNLTDLNQALTLRDLPKQ